LKRIVIGLCGAVLLSLAPVAAGAIKIDRIYFDSPGSDTGSNSSLNAEWIRLKNIGDKGRSLQGWKVRDRAGHVYRFGPYRLGAGNTVTIPHRKRLQHRAAPLLAPGLVRVEQRRRQGHPQEAERNDRG
jgi:hypothetical protein